jgi:hypothetical protein
MSEATNLSDTYKCICSRGSADGPTHSPSLDGQQMLQFGPEAARASHSAPPGSDAAPTTNGTYGRKCTAWCRSANLQRSLENRLRATTDLGGSPEYELTWSRVAMPSGAPICRLRALGHRTDGSGCSGWPTPKASTSEGPRNADTILTKYANQGRNVAHRLDEAAALAGWNTPRATGGTHGGPNQSGGALPADAALAEWATPAARDWKSEKVSDECNAERDAHPRGKPLSYQATLGPMPNGSPAATEKRGVLNPALSAWLMGYPEEIISCVDWGTR